jgi:internalin A
MLARRPRVTRLQVVGCKPADLAGFADVAPQLQYLHLCLSPLDNAMYDLQVLSTCSMLNTLCIHHKGILEGVGPLAGLLQLRELDMHYTTVCDVGPLEGLQQLSYLNLSSTHVSDVGPLGDLLQLRYLNLSHTPVSDVGALEALRMSETSGRWSGCSS